MKIRHHHTQKEGEFYAEEGGDRIGSVTYKRDKNERFVIKATHVDEEYRHKGLAHDLVHKATGYAHDHNIDVKVDCPFAKSILDEEQGSSSQQSKSA